VEIGSSLTQRVSPLHARDANTLRLVKFWFAFIRAFWLLGVPIAEFAVVLLLQLPSNFIAMASDKPIVVVKTSFPNLLRNSNHLAIYRDRVNITNRLVTAAYTFALNIFVHEYEENEHDENAFNADTSWPIVSSWNYYAPFKLELVELPNLNTYYELDNSI